MLAIRLLCCLISELELRVRAIARRMYFRKYSTSVRWAFVYSTIVWALFTLTDVYKNSQGARKDFALTISLRAAVTGVGIICVALSYFRAFFKAHMNQVVMVAIFIFGAVQVLFGVIESNTLDATYWCVPFRVACPSCCVVVWCAFVRAFAATDSRSVGGVAAA